MTKVIMTTVVLMVVVFGCLIGLCMYVVEVGRNNIVKEGDVIDRLILAEREIVVVKSDFVTDTYVAVAFKLRSRYVVIVNSMLLSLPKEQVEAVINHELGHIDLGHLNSCVSVALSNVERTLTDGVPGLEEEADNYSVARTGAKPLMDALISVNKDLDDKELVTRINRLRAQL